MRRSDDYDYAGYEKKYGKPDQSKGQHLTDEFKKPNHITFSDESVYHSKETPGGHWSQVEGKWHFAPSEHNIKTHGEERLKEYFNKVEKDAVLDLPKKSKYQQYREQIDSGVGE